ncbi:hypothetical protein [Rhodococcus sp. NPDC058514]|uniref:hypothetical protein n=1 Tax=unclassified Rhodococcus (in: high G+C Gram-positive bacteria) TaxID=192944 RepID=UPI003658C0F5
MQPAVNAALRLRRSGADSEVLRMLTVDGNVVVLRAGRLDGGGRVVRGQPVTVTRNGPPPKGSGPFGEVRFSLSRARRRG